MSGDRDYLSQTEVLNAYRDVAARQTNVAMHVFPGVLHGYMMPGSTKAFDATARDFSMARALALLEDL